MCEPTTIAAISAAIAGVGVAQNQVAKNTAVKPSGTQKGKTPDADLSPEAKRNKLLAQLAAGAARNNPTGGLAGTPNTGKVTLGG